MYIAFRWVATQMGGHAGPPLRGMEGEMKYGWVLVLFLCLVLVQGVRAEVNCPETPTATDVPPVYTETPGSPPRATPTDGPTPEDTRPPVAEPSPDPTATETPGVTGSPGEDEPVATLPVTGGGMPPHVQIGLTLICSIALLFVALMARAGRRTRDE